MCNFPCATTRSLLSSSDYLFHRHKCGRKRVSIHSRSFPCEKETKDVYCLFLHCQVTKQIWDMFLNLFRKVQVMPKSVKELIWCSTSTLHHPHCPIYYPSSSNDKNQMQSQHKKSSFLHKNYVTHSDCIYSLNCSTSSQKKYKLKIHVITSNAKPV